MSQPGKRKRGRPPKVSVKTEFEESDDDPLTVPDCYYDTIMSQPGKRKRGRPPKILVKTELDESDDPLTVPDYYYEDDDNLPAKTRRNLARERHDTAHRLRKMQLRMAREEAKDERQTKSAQRIAQYAALIEAIKPYPALYDPTHKDRTKISVNKVLWEQITEETGVERPNKVFCNLRVTYYRVKRREAEGRQSELRFHHYEQMKFLDPDATESKALQPPPQDTQDINLKKKHQIKKENNRKAAQDDRRRLKESLNLKRKEEKQMRKEEKQMRKEARQMRKEAKLAAKLERSSQPTERTAQNERLLELVQEHPSLYDKTHEDSRNRPTNVQLWKEIAEETGLERPSKTFSNLRTTYYRVKQRVAEGRQSELRFTHYEQMKFLDACADTERLASRIERTSKTIERTAQNERLIELVQEHPSLYDKTHEDSRNRTANLQLWKEIADETGLEHPNKVLCNLRATYYRVKRRVAEGRESGIRFAHYEQMKFLDAHPFECKLLKAQEKLSKKSAKAQRKEKRRKLKAMLKEQLTRHLLRERRDAKNEKLIEEVRKYPHIYDRTDSQRNDMSMTERKDVWEQIKKASGVKRPCKRFNSLRTSYFRVKERMARGGVGPIKFALFDKLRFLEGMETNEEPDEIIEEEEEGEKQPIPTFCNAEDSDDSFTWKEQI